jgi:hypothetical protein
MPPIKKKPAGPPAEEGFLTTAAQAIGSTLGQLAKKAGVVSSPAPSPARKKSGMKKRVAVKNKPAAKKKATPQKALQKRK